VHWQGQRFRSGEEVKMGVQEYLPLQDPPISALMEILSSCQGFINAPLCKGVMLNNNNTSLQYISSI